MSDILPRLKRLLELEAEAEKAQFLERLRLTSPQQREAGGTTLTALTVEDEYPGLGGRFILALRKVSRSALPFTKLDAGDPVILSGKVEGATWDVRAVVVERQSHVISVALDDLPPDLSETVLQVDASFDESTRRKEQNALNQVIAAKGNRLAALRDVALGQRAPQSQALDIPIKTSLNETQETAVRRALEAADFAIIHGPPGTGKTTTLVEVIRHALVSTPKILVTSGSNLGVDNLLERLVAEGFKAVRLGHPARVMESLRPYALDYQVEQHEDARLARKLMKEASMLFQQARRHRRAAPPKGAKQAAYSEAKALMADARKLEARALERVLDEAPILCATTTGLDPFLLGSRRFDLVVLDEAGQCTEPNAWIPLLRADKVVLAGDHCQLPATVLSPDAAKQGLGISLMERLHGLHGDAITTRLDLQYRMHAAIMEFPSQEFYEGTLKAGRELVSSEPLLFIDTAGAGFEEKAEADSGSRFNPKEAEVLRLRLEQLQADGWTFSQLALITPYAAQARYLRQLFPDPALEIDTIDGFQGREKDGVLISLVRSNEDQEIGFLKETRRLNVALTRPRKHLTVIGDSATLGIHDFFQRLVQNFETQSSYRSIWDFAPELCG